MKFLPNLLLSSLLLLASCVKEVKYEVTAIGWEYTNNLHNRVTKHDEGWSHPSDAFNIETSRKRRGTRKCDCRRDRNGRETCDTCPRYDTWYEYDYYAWPILKTVVTSNNDHAPYYGELPKLTGNQKYTTQEKYIIILSNPEEKEPREYKPSTLDEYKKFKFQDKWIFDKGLGVFRPNMLLERVPDVSEEELWKRMKDLESKN